MTKQHIIACIIEINVCAIKCHMIAPHIEGVQLIVGREHKLYEHDMHFYI